MADKEFAGLVRADDMKEKTETFSHPWNDKSEISGTRMSELAGLSRHRREPRPDQTRQGVICLPHASL